MDQIEKKLLEQKRKLDTIKAPDDLEDRLRSALKTTPSRPKRKSSRWILVAIAICMIVMISYQYSAFAYYGKKLLGFDGILSGTLKDLNDEGMGQVIDKSVNLANGTVLTLEGLMTDENQLILYYTLTNPNGLEDHSSSNFRPINITGFLTNAYQQSGTANMNWDHTELKGMFNFGSVNPFAKKLTLNYSLYLPNGHWVDDSISFDYQPNKAMQTVIKQKINKTVEVDQGHVTFNTITASPMSTVIEGKLNVENFDRVDLGLHGVELIANGSHVELKGSRVDSALSGYNFEIRFDGLPNQLDSLVLVMKDFVGYQYLQEKVPLVSGQEEYFALKDKSLWLRNISSTNKGIEITIATDIDVMLDGVSIETQEGITPLKTTVNQHSGATWKERTLLFETKEDPEYLLIEGMHYIKRYDHVIDISVD